MNPWIFLSYRREDSGSEAIALRNSLRQAFGEGSVFMDTASLQAGGVWTEELAAALKGATVILAVIGPDWLRAGSSEWGQRRIDCADDWVRQELTVALAENRKVIPVLVRGGRMPPPDVLPEPLKGLATRQAIELRGGYWDHDIKLLLAQVGKSGDQRGGHESMLAPYPQNPPEGPDPVGEEKLERILAKELVHWKKVETPLPEKPGQVRVELFREFRFKTFQDAIRFMHQVAPGCDIAVHHPRWENVWRTVRVYLTTWDIGHRISDRDIQLARYFDRAYGEFSGAAPAKKQGP
jgi:pterin-4a-carbinolamine dehydratase